MKITYAKHLAVAVCLTQLPTLLRAADQAGDPESAAHANWRAIMKQVPAPDKGCFHASYPSFVWETVDCTIAPPRTTPTHVKLTDVEPEVVGNGDDYVAVTTGLIYAAGGGFQISGVTFESSVGVAAFGGGGILGANEYSVQLNTNDDGTTPACAGHNGCTVWQQFIYATDSIGKGTAAVFMQYWLLNWGSSACPSGWAKNGSDCFVNSPLAPAPDIPITDLGHLELDASAQAGGHDSVTLYYGSDVFTETWSDTVLDISSVWNEAEFNVLGNGGGSQAVFNYGSTIEVNLFLWDGSGLKPTCLANAGTTGETNNMFLGSCSASVTGPAEGLPRQSIEFSESILPLVRYP